MDPTTEAAKATAKVLTKVQPGLRNANTTGTGAIIPMVYFLK